MTLPVNLDDAARRPVRYWTQDGLTEILLGLMMAVPMVIFRLGERLPKGSGLIMLLPLAWGAVIVVLVRSFRRFKDRVIAPRAGYVKLQDPGRARQTLTILSIAAAAVFTYTFPLRHWDPVASLVVALFFAACFAAGGIQARQPHFAVLAAVPLLAGLWLYANRIGLEQALFWLLVTQGVALSVSGALRLRGFLRAHPRADDPRA